MKKSISILILFFSFHSIAGILRCQILNDTTGLVLAAIEISTQATQGVPPKKIKLRHPFMSADITIRHKQSDPTVFSLKIEAFDSINRSAETFIHSVEILYAQGYFNLGQVKNSMVHLANETLTSCSWSN